jgi:BirA family biotin operon repressor/biotin-[acetyl-CoA-carboxylase] ligase
MAASISVAAAIKKICNLKVEIKWPNDILYQRKKICGILTEIETINNKISNSIVGIGINVNNLLDSDLKSIATTLKIITDSELSIFELFKEILKNFDYNYEKIKSCDYLYIKNQWCNYSNIIGRKIEVINDDSKFNGIVVDIDDDGCLILNKGERKIKIIYGDIKYL